MVNFDAGAQTPAAGAYTAVGIAFATLFLTPALYYLPNATLAGTIIVAVLSLIDLGRAQAHVALLQIRFCRDGGYHPCDSRVWGEKWG